MRKLQRRFETVPLAEVLATAIEVNGHVVNGHVDIKNKKDQADGVRHGAGTEALRRQPMTPGSSTAEPLSLGFGRAMEVKTPTKRVLVVDDEQHIANTLAAMLRDRGYEAAAAYDAISGLAHCEACPPDLIVSDVVMPGMNGVELAMVVKQLYPPCKVLLVSELATSADFLEHAHRNGYDFELLAKPLHLSELLARVEALT